MHDIERPLPECVFTAADVKYLESIAWMLATLSKFRSLLPRAKNLKLAVIIEQKSRQGISKTYFSGNRAALFCLGHAGLDGSANSSKKPTEVVKVLERL